MLDLDQIVKRLAVAKNAAASAGEILNRLLGSASIDRKESNNLVTEADRLAELEICRQIREQFPEDDWFLEEGESSAGLSADQLWIVDPLDGTNGFAHGIPHYSVSIAYAEKGSVQMGVVLDPQRREMFSAIRKGESDAAAAFLNDQPIHVSRHNQLTDCLISTGFYYDRSAMMRDTLQAMERLFEQNVQGIRRFGSAALDIAWVACGRFDGHFEYQLSPWDYAAAWFILEAAGGVAYTAYGDSMHLDSGSMIATNGFNSSQLLPTVVRPR